ncbi:MAG TPA: glycosyl hydrolase [Gemmatimonadales bacterium]|jgi:xylan 1,4-beta-xylosidase|nr:glycosyl hydrolase [Gemmatimonadales bacterium]
MKPIEFRCALDGATVPLPHVWERIVGSGHAALVLRADFLAQLARAHRELGFQYLRFHGLLNDEMGVLMQQGQERSYSFFNVHRLWDSLLELKMRPFVELSFMPTAIASGHSTVFRYRGNVTPPRQWSDWGTLIRRLAAGAVARYGAAEVKQWFFEVWNEPNLRSFWRGTRAQYLRLYQESAFALKEIHPELQVGGPATAHNGWLDAFLDECERMHVPVDFVSTHHYPTDRLVAQGGSTEAQLAAMQLDILREEVQDARRRARGKPLFYTEWNTSADGRDPLHDSSYAAAFIIRTVLQANGLTDAYAFWTFSDIFEEQQFPSQPFHGGFGLLSWDGIAKPSYRAFELLHRLGTELITPMDGMHANVAAWVARNGRRVMLLAINNAPPGHDVVPARALIHLTTRATVREATVERIDGSHANPRQRWLDLGAPESLGPAEVEELHAASALRPEPQQVRCDASGIHVEFDLPEHSVAAVTLDLAGSPPWCNDG